MIYYHISATVNGAIVDIMVSYEEFNSADFVSSDYFKHGATDIQINGHYDLTLVGGQNTLPDVIG